jgi:hypothetical protein
VTGHLGSDVDPIAGTHDRQLFHLVTRRLVAADKPLPHRPYHDRHHHTAINVALTIS